MFSFTGLSPAQCDHMVRGSGKSGLGDGSVRTMGGGGGAAPTPSPPHTLLQNGDGQGKGGRGVDGSTQRACQSQVQNVASSSDGARSGRDMATRTVAAAAQQAAVGAAGSAPCHLLCSMPPNPPTPPPCRADQQVARLHDERRPPVAGRPEQGKVQVPGRRGGGQPAQRVTWHRWIHASTPDARPLRAQQAAKAVAPLGCEYAVRPAPRGLQPHGCAGAGSVCTSHWVCRPFAAADESLPAACQPSS